MMDEVLKKLVNGEDLTTDEAYRCMREIMKGDVKNEKVASFLTAYRMKGETIDEIVGFAKVMRENALSVDKSQFESLIDTCGTGGDGIYTFNISTTAMFIAAGAGVKIAKHGNKSITSKSGAADVLESLGVNIDLGPKEVLACIKKSNIGFMFAPKFHASMKHVASIRKELGFRTVFNILGPLANPADADIQLLGVFDQALLGKLANALLMLGIKKAMVVHGSDGMDEITLTGKTYVAEILKGEIIEYEIDPKEYGFSYCKLEDLKGGDPKSNAEILVDILKGRIGAKTDIALLNAGAVIYLFGKAKTLCEGIILAKKSIREGLALEALQKLIQCSNEGSI